MRARALCASVRPSSSRVRLGVRAFLAGLVMEKEGNCVTTGEGSGRE